jgi:hypothetical protein
MWFSKKESILSSPRSEVNVRNGPIQRGQVTLLGRPLDSASKHAGTPTICAAGYLAMSGKREFEYRTKTRTFGALFAFWHLTCTQWRCTPSSLLNRTRRQAIEEIGHRGMLRGALEISIRHLTMTRLAPGEVFGSTQSANVVGRCAGKEHARHAEQASSGSLDPAGVTTTLEESQ